MNIVINEQAQPSIKKIDLGQQYENNDLTLSFEFHETLKSLNKYAIFVHQKQNNPVNVVADRTLILPISNNSLKITNNITNLSGNWKIYFMFREHALDTTQTKVDINAQNDERVAICELDGFVNPSTFETTDFENIQIDENIQIVYDDLLSLQARIHELLDETDALKNEIVQEANNYTDDVATATYSHVLDTINVKGGKGEKSTVMGSDCVASGKDSVAIGRNTQAISRQAFAEGDSTVAGDMDDYDTSQVSPINDYETGSGAHAEGVGTFAKGQGAHAEGYKTKATGIMAHAENTNCIASGRASHAEGDATQSTGNFSHSEGGHTKASGYWSHAEGCNDDDSVQTESIGIGSHAEGQGTKAYGNGSHSQNVSTIARGRGATACGIGTESNCEGQFVLGKYNVKDDNKEYAFIVGGGTSATDKKNLFGVKWNGEIVTSEFSGGVSEQDFITYMKKYLTDTIKKESLIGVVDGYYPVAKTIDASGGDGNDTLINISAPQVETISIYGLSKCRSLQTFSLPNLKTIERGGFKNCTSLTSITFSKTLTEIETHTLSESGAFFGCTSLETIQFNSPTMVKLENVNAFEGCTSLKTIKVTEASIEDYKNDPIWSSLGVEFVTFDSWGPLM